MKFEEKLIQLRKSNSMSQEDLADKLGVSRQAVSRWELGATMPDAPNLVKLGELFGVSIDYLLHDDYENTNEIPAQNTTKKNKKFHLTAAICWIIAGICFIIAACLSTNDVARTLYIVCVILDSLNAGINIHKYYE